jgi:hypothetical protein
MTRDLKAMASWSASEGVQAIAMEATGLYWKPVWNILEAGKKFKLVLVNAHHIKHVPGRKTDQKDSEWIAELLQHGLLRASFVPPVEIRQLRDLTRMRARIRQTLASFANRIQKVLEDANIKLGSVASDVLGVSGRHMLKALMTGEQDPQKLADLAQGHLRKKIEPLKLALQGNFTDHHRLQLKLLLEFVEFGEQLLSNLDSEIQLLLSKVQGEPGLPGPADGTVAEAEARRNRPAPYKLPSSSGTAYRVSINWRPPFWLQKLGPIWISFPVRMTWPAGRGFVRAIMRARGSVARERPAREASGFGVPSAKRRGPPRARKIPIWQHSTTI